MISADQWIQRLGLQRHPEGGYFSETYRSRDVVSAGGLPTRYQGARVLSTSIYFLLTVEEPSHFHRVASDEIWYFHAGSPLTLHLIDPTGIYRTEFLGADVDAMHAPQVVIPHGNWFAATVDRVGGYSLVGCSVAPGFEFCDFELAKRSDLLVSCPSQQELIVRLTRI